MLAATSLSRRCFCCSLSLTAHWGASEELRLGGEAVQSGLLPVLLDPEPKMHHCPRVLEATGGGEALSRGLGQGQIKDVGKLTLQ